MFYSHTYLRRRGRFGLIWLAATQSKVLSKRELYAINIAMTCSDILDHIPGQLSKEISHRPRRFSLYLSSQLMYGSAKVLQKQWEYLLTDLTVLIRKLHPEVSPTTEIDLIIVRPDPVTLDSCVPGSIKDKHYDPFFGLFKDSTVNVEALLDVWDNTYTEICQLSPSRMPLSVKAEIGSPFSVSDPKEIQIRDQDILPIDPLLPGEQDLPMLDQANLELLGQSEQEVQISSQELLSPRISEILAATEVTQIQDVHDLLSQRPPVEETPAARTGGEMPGTPQKRKRKRRHGSPDGRRTKHKVADTGVEAGEGDRSVQTETHQAEVVPQPMETEQHVPAGEDGQPISPVTLPRHSHDWLQKNPPLQLPPVTPSPSPVRKRKPHKLIIDEKLQMSRDEIKQNMLTSDTTCMPLVWPDPRQSDWLKDPGSAFLKYPPLAKLWHRNCKFGLRTYETDTDSSQSSAGSESFDLLKRKRGKSQLSEDETPHRGMTQISDPSSIERGRALSALSASLEGGERSRSLVAPASDDSMADASASRQKAAALSDHERSAREGSPSMELNQTQMLDLGILHPWPEEQEHMISPVALAPEARPDSFHGAVAVMSPQAEERAADGADTPRTRVLRMVKGNIRTMDDWTTFRIICPPSSTNRVQAAQLFMALCCQVAKQNLCVRQDEPYSDIFIWLPADRST